MIKGWAKPKSAAEYADVSEGIIREWMKSGLPYADVSERITLIRLVDLDRFLESRVKTRNDVETAVDDVITSMLKNERRANGRKNQGKNSRFG